MAAPTQFSDSGSSIGSRALAFLLFAAIALAAVAFPLYVIRPFRYQGPQELRLALAVLRWSPWITVLCALATLLLAPGLWQAFAARRLAGLRRIGLIVGLLLAGFSVVAARVNVFEKMFHPISALQFLPAAKAQLASDDMLLAVTIGGESHAYPIREMAYHHVVNDVVGDTPVVGTY